MNGYQRFLVRRLYELQMDYAFRDPMTYAQFKIRYEDWLYRPMPKHVGLHQLFMDNTKVRDMCYLLEKYRPAYLYGSFTVDIIHSALREQFVKNITPNFLRPQ